MALTADHPVLDEATRRPRSGLRQPAPIASGVDHPVPILHARPKRWAERYALRLAVTDVLALGWAAAGVHVVRLNALPGDLHLSTARLPFVAFTTALILLWLAALGWGDTRDPKVVGHGPEEYKRVLNVSFMLFGLMAIASYLFDLSLPRSYLLIMMPAGLGAILASRFIWRRWLVVRRDAGHMSSRVLVVGDSIGAIDLVQELGRAPRAGYQVVGLCLTVNRGDATLTELGGVPVVGSTDDVLSAARSVAADVVAVTSTAAFGPAKVRRLSWDLEGTRTGLVLAPALTNVAGPRIHTQPVAGLPLIHVESPTYRGANRFLKKAFDLVGALALLVLLAPILVALSLTVGLTSKGPVFFTQRRVGLGGRDFKMIKFRSMVADAERRLAELKTLRQDAGNETLFKMKGDPRITKVGRFIRRFSLDELPQLLNVIKGDMSLVGPRPPLMAEVEKYGDEARLRLLVKPGMTGLWQVSGRSDLTWEETVRLDVYYVENWSITSDLVILWKTARAVVGSGGAY